MTVETSMLKNQEGREWCEPGTKISINGEDIRVRPNGLFLAKPGTAGGASEIKITATSSKGTKEIIRKIAAR